MNVPGTGLDPHQQGSDKWRTIRYAIEKWGTTFRLLLVLAAVSAPTYVIAWLIHR